MKATRLLHFLNGAYAPPADAGTFDTENPSAPDDVLAHVPAGHPDDVHAAVKSAEMGFEHWRPLTGVARADHLFRWAQVITQKAEELAQAMTREVGKPIAEARGEAARAAAILRYYAGEAVREVGDVIPSQLPDTLQFSERHPLGVCALITPWNFPIAIPLWKAAPALAFGNTVVLKPAESSSYVASLLAETAQIAGLPAGVFNVLFGKGETSGRGLVEHPGVRAVSFTGSQAVGRRIAMAAAARNIRHQTEMGGKNAAIILHDADLHRAAALVASGAMRFAGQKCTATSRVMIEKKVYEPFLKLLLKQVEAMKVFPATDADCAVGPLIADAARRRITAALSESPCRVLIGGGVPAGAGAAEGYFFAPTIVGEAPSTSTIANDELFGPVLAAFPVEDVEEGVQLANNSPYGLSAALFTRDLRAVMHYTKKIQAGMIRVNGDTTGVDPHAPFGGVKGSSSGTREQGPAAREFYTETKTIQISPG